MSDQPTLFDPGPAGPPAPRPEISGAAWCAEYRRVRAGRIEGTGGWFTADAERQAARRFARRHGLGRDWVRFCVGPDELSVSRW